MPGIAFLLLTVFMIFVTAIWPTCKAAQLVGAENTGWATTGVAVLLAGFVGVGLVLLLAVLAKPLPGGLIGSRRRPRPDVPGSTAPVAPVQPRRSVQDWQETDRQELPRFVGDRIRLELRSGKARAARPTPFWKLSARLGLGGPRMLQG